MLEKLKAEEQNLRRTFHERIISSIVAALGLVAGLAWNEAIKALIEFLFPFGKETLLPKFGYAVIMTLVVTVLIYYLARLFVPKETNNTESRI